MWTYFLGPSPFQVLFRLSFKGSNKQMFRQHCPHVHNPSLGNNGKAKSNISSENICTLFFTNVKYVTLCKKKLSKGRQDAGLNTELVAHSEQINVAALNWNVNVLNCLYLVNNLI